MKKAEVKIGQTYIAKVSGILSPVKILGDSSYGGWDGMNIQTKRRVRIKTAGRLRRRVDTPTSTVPSNLPLFPKCEPWEFWTGQKCCNQQTGEVYIATASISWDYRMKTWREALQQSKQDDTKCSCPSPMPEGHLMFEGNLQAYSCV